jgi:hypothetical protein
MKYSVVFLRHSDTNCLPIGNITKGGHQERWKDGPRRSMTDRGGTEGDGGEVTIARRNSIVQWTKVG